MADYAQLAGDFERVQRAIRFLEDNVRRQREAARLDPEKLEESPA